MTACSGEERFASPPILDATEKGDLETVKKLVKSDKSLVQVRDAVLNAQPLHIAARYNQVAVAQFLIDHGADIDAQGDHGQTPLHGTAYNGAVEVARLLIARGANLNPVDDSGLTPLFMAIIEASPRGRSLVNVFLNAGAAIDLHSAVLLAKTSEVTSILAADGAAIDTAM